LNTWTEAQPPEALAAAIEELRPDEPEAWLLFEGDEGPRHAPWAHVAAGFADDLPLAVAIGVVDDLRGPLGRAARAAGMSPCDAAHLLAARYEHPSRRARLAARQQLVPAPVPEDVQI
jgi:hypothetical protein